MAACDEVNTVHTEVNRRVGIVYPRQANQVERQTIQKKDGIRLLAVTVSILLLLDYPASTYLTLVVVVMVR